MTSTTRHRSLTATAAGLAVVLVTLIAHQTLATAAAPTGPSVVATLDLERLFDGLDGRARADADLQAMAEELDAEGVAKRDAIDALKAEMEIYAIGSDKYNEAMEALSLMVLEFEAFMEFGRRKIDVEKALSIKRIYIDIRDGVRNVAQNNGYDVVLVDDSVVQMPSGSEADVKRNISARRILYANPTIDITDELIQFMNTP
jgi:Skp family chaperone for outer membrane proteins